jgi:4-nitrophenyl phosphatase
MKLKEKYAKFDNFIFDLDGTVWKWDRLIAPGAERVFEVLKKEGKNYLFITNNTSLLREGYAAKLRRFGIPARTEQIFHPSMVAAKMFYKRRVFCIGEKIVQYLKKSGVIIDKKKPEVVLVCEDRKFDFEKCTLAVKFVIGGAELYKITEGGLWVMGDSFVPGAGAVAAMIEAAANIKGIKIGKPSNYICEILPKLRGRTLLIGDECKSDIAMGKKLGFTTLLVRSGADNILSQRCELCELQKPPNCGPDFVEDNILAMIE